MHYALVSVMSMDMAANITQWHKHESSDIRTPTFPGGGFGQQTMYADLLSARANMLSFLYERVTEAETL